MRETAEYTRWDHKRSDCTMKELQIQPFSSLLKNANFNGKTTYNDWIDTEFQRQWVHMFARYHQVFQEVDDFIRFRISILTHHALNRMTKVKSYLPLILNIFATLFKLTLYDNLFSSSVNPLSDRALTSRYPASGESFDGSHLYDHVQNWRASPDLW